MHDWSQGRARAVGAVLALAACAACGGGRGAGAEVAPGGQAASPWAGEMDRGVRSAALAAVLRDHWEWEMRRQPVWATQLGDHRFDAELADRSEAALEEARATRVALRDRLRALEGLDAGDATTRDLLLAELDAALGLEVCRFETWNVSARANAVSAANHLAEVHPVVSPEDGETLLARLRAVPRALDVEVGHLRRGIAEGRTGSRETVARTLALVRGQLETPVERWALLEPAQASRPGWSAEAREAFARALRAQVEGEIQPAFARYAAFLEGELLPAARDEARVGVGHLPDGDACYRATIREHLALDRDPEALHQLGLREIARTDAAIAEIGARVFGDATLARTLARLRADAALHFDTREAVEAEASRALARARAAIPRYFGRLPRADCTVRRVPDFEAPFTTIAYYRPPTPDGSRPGEYYVNSWRPEVRPRYEMAALTFHESIPGHHLQIAIAQELEDVPVFRRHLGATAFVEGWALYAERLAVEMGLYEGDLDRLGQHSYQAWRAARLVVDTGLHALGWTREEAEAFMLAHTALAEENVRNEVDRYVGTPGQALAYMVGQLEIVRLRAEAEAALGDRFDLPAFHDVVLGGGAVTLPVLEARVRELVADRR